MRSLTPLFHFMMVLVFFGFHHECMGHIYVVKKGDNLSHSVLGASVPGPVWGKNGSMNKVLVLNPHIKNPNQVFPGMKIKLNGLVPPIEIQTRESASVDSVTLPSAAVSDTEIELPSVEVHSESVGFTPSLAFTQIHYNETGVKDYNANALTLKLNYRRPLNSRWDFGVNTFFTAHTLSSNTAGTDLRMLGLNVRAGYTIPITSRIRLNLMGGVYYSTMIVSKKSFGYSNLSGPQVFPVLSHQVNSDRDSIYVYGKFSPMSNGLNLTFNGNEKALGAGYVLNASNANLVTMSVDYAEVNLNFNSLLYMRARSLSLGMGVSW